MDTRTGEIMGKEELQKRMGKEAFKDHAKPIREDALSSRRRRQLERTGKTKVGPNEKCPCGSGRKFKKCCMHRPAEPKVKVDTSKPITQETIRKAYGPEGTKTGRMSSEAENKANEGKGEDEQRSSED